MLRSIQQKFWNVYLIKNKDMLFIFCMPPSVALLGAMEFKLPYRDFLENINTFDFFENIHDRPWPKIS